MDNSLKSQIKSLFTINTSRVINMEGKKFLGFRLQKSSKKLQFGQLNDLLRKGAAYEFADGKLSLFIVMRKEGRTYLYQGTYTGDRKRWYENIPDTIPAGISYEKNQRVLSGDEITQIEKICKNYFIQDRIVDAYLTDPDVDFVVT